ncbi:structural constituent of ribosome [Homalodisca vitripennis]|nr:structural constituent of ribosome [Homalodisca vitripennis]
MSLFSKVIFSNLMKFGCLSTPISKFHITQFRPLVVAPAITLKSRSYCQEHSTEEGQEEKKIVDSAKDRSKIIPVEVSIQYLQSSAYKTTYGGDPVWKQYRRNHLGQIPPRKTRKRCIRQDMISTGNPCPICRDEYLVLHPKNIELLKQFISPHTGAILSYQLTGLCQRRHIELEVAIMQAKDMGLITFDLPFQKYDYSEYVDVRKLQ